MQKFTTSAIQENIMPICAFCGNTINKSIFILNGKRKVCNLIPCEYCQELMNRGFTFVKLDQNNQIIEWTVCELKSGKDFIESLIIPSHVKKS